MSNIVLVGASNVGKSSIFNYLTKSKQAIISPIPGTTRDRIFGSFEYDQQVISVCDTGGLGDDSLEFAEDLTAQTNIAIDAADVIWFVVDVTNVEPSTIDKNLSKFLRRFNKPIFLVVNKIDLSSEQHHTFYQLGFKTIYPVSSRTKTGFNELLAASIVELPDENENIYDVSIAIIGRPNVGKSTWLNMLSKQKRFITSDYSGTTRDASYTEIKYKNKLIQLVDTAGIKHKKNKPTSLDFYAYVRTMQAIHDVDVVCLMLDAEAGIVSQDKKLMHELIQIGKPFFILFNKSDLIDHKNYLSELDGYLPKNVLINEVSAYSRQGRTVFFKNLFQLYDESLQVFSTNQLNNILLKVVSAHEPPLHQGRRTRLRYIHQIQQSPRTFKIHGKQTGKLSADYIRYLENSLRRELDLNHIPLKIFFKDDANPYI